MFKYVYNNRTQYECALEPYNIEPASAVDTINILAKKYNHREYNGPDAMECDEEKEICDEQLHITTLNGLKISIKFQTFHDAPVQSSGYSTIPTDGFIVLDSNMNYIKHKYQKTIEVEYDANLKTFKTLDSDLSDHKITLGPEIEELCHGAIYEAAATANNCLNIIKIRRDRLVPN